MTQQDQTPRTYGLLGAIDGNMPLRGHHLLRLIGFALVVVGLLWLQWGLLQVHEKLATVLLPVGELMPNHASRIISGTASMLVIFAAWTATWAIFPLSDPPLRIRLRNLLALSAILCVYGVIVLAAEASGAGLALRAVPFMPIDGFAYICVLLFLLRFHPANPQRDLVKTAVINTEPNGLIKNGETHEPR